MAINYAVKYSPLVDEKFRLGRLTAVGTNNDYGFEGVGTVKIFSIPTVAMNDYTTSGSNRYGAPADLQNEIQELLLNKDRAFTFVIDKKSSDDTMGAMDAGKALARQIEEVAIPEIDKETLKVLFTDANTTKGTATAATKANAYELFLKGTESLSENKVPEGGRIAFVTPAFYNLLKLDPAFVKASEAGQDMLVKGAVGMVDGVNIVKVPTSYFPTKGQFAIVHPAAVIAPVKLTEYKIHTDAPGISGYLVEGRLRYGIFVLKQKAKAVYTLLSA